jgi:DNA polymerase III subunit beta
MEVSMKVKFNRAALQEALTTVMTVIPGRTPKPVLQCMRVTADKDAIHLSATDLEVGITYTISQVEVSKTGTVVIPADKFSSIVRESADDTIEMETDENSAHLRGSDSVFTVYTQDPAQYPAVPGFDGQADFEVNMLHLQEAIQQTLFSAARESTRYALNGVLWEVHGKKLSLVATDGRRLAKSILSLDKTAKEPQGRTIVPSKAMSLLEKIPATEKTTASLKFADNQLTVTCESVVISSNLVEGNFPKYEDIIPKDYEKKLVLSTSAFHSAVKRAALLAGEDSKGIRLALNKGKMIITSRAPETGDAQIDMAVEYAGESIEVGFNPQYLVDVLRVLKADTFELHLGQSDRPGLIKSGPSFLYIVMPVNL